MSEKKKSEKKKRVPRRQAQDPKRSKGGLVDIGAGTEPVELRNVSRPAKRVIEEAKDRVETLALANFLCGPGKMRKVGDKWTARCPLPDHGDMSPSFTVYPADRGWFCYGCLRGGDVIELARFAWGYEKEEAKIAAAQLLHEFGHPIPERPRSWYTKQERQKPIRNAMEEARVGHYQRRLFRIFLPMIEEIQDDAERLEEVEYLWGAAREIAVLAVAGRAS